jgi:broad-specificity NMP kinase
VDQSPVPLKHINVSELIKEKMLHDGFDEEWQTYIVDEDKVCSYHHLVGLVLWQLGAGTSVS